MSLSLTTGDKCDDYTTPKDAFEMLLPYIDTSNIIYEPFYCEGLSAQYLTELGYNVIHKNEDFYENWSKYDFDIIITNPPYSSKVKVFKELYKIDKPFAVLVPVSTITKLFLKQIFNQHLDKIGMIVPPKRIHFIKGGVQSKRNWFDVVWITYKIDLPTPITFC